MPNKQRAYRYFNTLAHSLHDTEDVIKDVGKDVGKEILVYLKQTPNLTIPQLSEKLSVSIRTIERHIAKLQKENKITRVGGRKEEQWEII